MKGNVIIFVLGSFLITILFTSIIYNLNAVILANDYVSENRIIKYTFIMLFYFFFYVISYHKIEINEMLRLLIIFLPPVVIDSSVIFTAPNLIPLRFPFATLFPMLGLALGFTYYKFNKTVFIALSISSTIFIYYSNKIIIPRIVYNIEKRAEKFFVNDDFMNSNFMDVKSRKVNLHDVANAKCILIDIFFVGCTPCDYKFESLNQIEREFHSKNFRIIAICDGNITSKKRFSEYIKMRSNPNIIYLYDSQGKNLQKYRIHKYPFEILLNQNHVENTLVGFNPESTQLYLKDETKRIKKILSDF